MTVDVATRQPPAPEQAPAAEKSRFSLEGLQESRPARAAMGVLLSAAVAALIYVIVLAFTGHFTSAVKVPADLPQGSNAVPIDAPVEYRNVTVGKVISEGAGSAGHVVARLEIYPSKAAVIPKGVTAQVAPLSIFGNQYIQLVPPPVITADTPHLSAADRIGPYGGAPSTSLQGTVAQLYKLLDAVHPAQLDTALSAFATALNGEGKALGQTLRGASSYLQVIAPRLSTIQSDLRLTVPVSNSLAKATPALLGTLSNSSVTAQTITNDRQELQTLLRSGAATVGQLDSVLSQVQGSLPSMINESGPLLSDVTQNPNELSLTLEGLGSWAAAWAAAESSGPYLSVSANLPVANISAGVNAALGYDNPASIDAALGSEVNPPTYTSANCPQYPGESNPYCGTGGSPDAAPVPSSVAAAAEGNDVPAAAGADRAASAGSSAAPAAGQSTAAGSESAAAPVSAQQQAVDDIATAVNGGQPPASPDVASVLLLSLLSSMSFGR